MVRYDYFVFFDGANNKEDRYNFSLKNRTCGLYRYYHGYAFKTAHVQTELFTLFVWRFKNVIIATPTAHVLTEIHTLDKV